MCTNPFADQGNPNINTGGQIGANSHAAILAHQAQVTAEEALKEQRKARDQAAEIAAAGQAGSERSRKAADKKIRQMLESQGFGGLAMGSPRGPAPVAYRAAMGV